MSIYHLYNPFIYYIPCSTQLYNAHRLTTKNTFSTWNENHITSRDTHSSNNFPLTSLFSIFNLLKHLWIQLFQPLILLYLRSSEYIPGISLNQIQLTRPRSSYLALGFIVWPEPSRINMTVTYCRYLMLTCSILGAQKRVC